MNRNFDRSTSTIADEIIDLEKSSVNKTILSECFFYLDLQIITDSLLHQNNIITCRIRTTFHNISSCIFKIDMDIQRRTVYKTNLGWYSPISCIHQGGQYSISRSNNDDIVRQGVNARRGYDFSFRLRNKLRCIPDR